MRNFESMNLLKRLIDMIIDITNELARLKKPFREKYNLVSIILLLNVTSNAFCPSKLFLEGVVR